MNPENFTIPSTETNNSNNVIFVTMINAHDYSIMNTDSIELATFRWNNSWASERLTLQQRAQKELEKLGLRHRT